MGSSIHRAITCFLCNVKVKPKLLYTDFDQKLISGKVATLVEDNEIDLQAAPPKPQPQNSPVEQSWQIIVTMTRNWLISNLLPSTFWYYGIKQACEILNIMPTSQKKNKMVTPHELVHNTKVDYRSHFPLFSTAYIKQ